MKYTCLIIDDEKLARELIASHVEKIDSLEVVASCASAIEASAALKQQKIDLLFLDIEMPALKGTELVPLVDKGTKIIFTTAYREYALEGFELEVLDYLLKPITFARLFRAVEKFLALKETIEPVTTAASTPNSTTDYIFVSERRKQVRIELNELDYVESVKDYVHLHLSKAGSSATHIVKSTLGDIEAQLDGRFQRVHRSYIVNSEKITAYTKHDIEIGSKEIPIGGNYREQLSRFFAKL